MTRNLKTLGFAMFAAFALSAVAASTASAHLFTSTIEKTVLTGKTEAGVDSVFTRGGASVVCDEGIYAGTTGAKTVSEVTVHPLYGPHCTIGFTSDTVTVDTDGCDYILTGTTHTANDATTSVECTSGHEITITVTSLGMTFHIPPQANLAGVKYTNLPNHLGGESVTLQATITGITSTCTGGAVACFLVGGGAVHTANASYTDTIEVTGFAENSMSPNATTHVWSGAHSATRANIKVD